MEVGRNPPGGERTPRTERFDVVPERIAMFDITSMTQAEAVAKLRAALDDENHQPEGYWESLMGFSAEGAIGIDDSRAAVITFWVNALIRVCEEEIAKDGIEAVVARHQMEQRWTDGTVFVWSAESLADSLFETYEEQLCGHLIC
jgi:hypothetical protein